MDSNWNNTRLSSFLKKVRRTVDVEPDTLYYQIGIRSFGKGVFHKEPVTIEELGSKQVYWVEPGDFTLNIVFAWEGAVALISESEKGMCASHRFPTFVIDKTVCDPHFLLEYFKTEIGIEQLALASPGGAGRNKTLNQSDFLNLTVPLPPLDEQRRIADILSAWYCAIDLTTQLITAKQQRKRGLMQQLLTGQRRFAEFEDEEWANNTIAECADILDNRRVPLNEKQRSSMVGNIPYWGANNIVGYVNDYIFDETVVLLAEDGGYFEEYSTRPIANISYGKCWVNNHAHVLRAKQQTTNEWLYYCLVHKNILPYINSGTRSKLNQGDMVKIEIPLPRLAEQRRIAAVLQACDEEIALLEQKRNLLQQQKQGLMQQLLTGRVRVNVDEATT